MNAEFDRYASVYSELLHDSIRNHFAAESTFFHERKWMLIQDFLAGRGMEPPKLKWLDVGCGAGALLHIAGKHFALAAGCDPSAEMIRSCNGMDVRLQPSTCELPFADGTFDLVTAVCVYHHVHGRDRTLLANSIRRVLKPGGIFCMIEHNPWNPVTQLIVRRCPVDRDAELLAVGHATALFRSAGLKVLETSYFLYFPQPLFVYIGRAERLLRRLALGGQFAIFGVSPGRS